MFSGMFSTANSAPAGGNNGPTGTVPPQQPNADQVFGDVFEDVRWTFLSPSRLIDNDGSPLFLKFFFLLLRSFYGQRSNGISHCGPG